MENEIEKIHSVLDTLIMENALHNVQLTVIEKLLLQLSDHLLGAEESKDFQKKYNRTLIDGTSSLASLRDSLHSPARLAGFLMDYQSMIRKRLNDLDS